jgi:hypothetical protein
MESVCGSRGPEYENITRMRILARYSDPGPSLFNSSAGNDQTVLPICPPYKAGAIKAALRGNAACAVFLAYLAVCGIDYLVGQRGCWINGSARAAAVKKKNRK